MVIDPVECIEITADSAGQGERLDKFLSSLAQISSRSRAAQLISENYVTVNSKCVKPSYCLRAGDFVQFRLPTQQNTQSIVPMNLKLDILYEDTDLLVVNKPAGLVVHPAAGHAQDTLVNALVHHTSDLSIGFHEKRPGIVHRLDKDTSGLLVIAKNDFAHQNLAQQFKVKTTQRVYWALIYGHYSQQNGTFRSQLARHPLERKRFSSTKKEGKIAITHYQQVNYNSQHNISQMELQLETGRTHQIRVHVSESGHPIIGDKLYGSTSRLKSIKNKQLKTIIQNLPRFALHATELGFVHPRTQKNMRFKVDWPADLDELLILLDFKSSKP